MTDGPAEAFESDAVSARRPVPRLLVAGIVIVGFFVLVALLAPFIAPFDAVEQDIPNKLAAPSTEHWLGTDEVGRDVFSRVIWATRVDLPIGFLAALFPMILGTFLGALAAYFGGWVDFAVTRTAEVVQAFPIYVFLIALIFALGPGIRSILITFTAVSWVLYARLIRGEILRIRNREYVQAAEALGYSHARILTRHLLPNAGRQTLVYFASDVVLALITLAALSYFGLGVQPPTPEWGAMIAAGQRFLRTQWWLSVTPGLVIAALGTGLSLISDGLDEWLKDA